MLAKSGVSTVITVTKISSASLLRSGFSLYALPPVLYAAAIIGVSSIPDLSGPELPVIPFDKAAHLLEYCGFGILTLRAFTHFLHRFRAPATYLFSLTAVTCLGAFDEWYQSFVPGRSSDWLDFLADISGGLLALGIFWLWQRPPKAR